MSVALVLKRSDGKCESREAEFGLKREFRK
jgi:hypothetical protein